MPDFPAETPPDGLLVAIALSNGPSISAYWQDSQWWAGLDNNPFDVPISNDYVVSWELIA
jgi:hypothetical protein